MKNKVTKRMLKQALLKKMYNIITGPTILTTNDIEILKIILKKTR